MKIHIYKVRAIGLGLGFLRYPLNFEILSNNDIDKDEIEREMVMQKVRKEIGRTFQHFEILSVKKEVEQ